MNALSLFGQPVRRVEDSRFLRGEGRYVDDLATPGALHAVFLRSPHAHARLLSLDVGAARAAPGVRLVLTGEVLAQAGIGGLPCTSVLAAETPLVKPDHPCLALHRVRHVGEAVACVVAGTAHQAEDAAELILAEYDALPAVTDHDAALAPGAPLLHAEAPGNLAFLWHKGDAAAVAAGFAPAARWARR